MAEGRVYFIQANQDGPIKIGYTRIPVARRLSDLQVGSFAPLALLGTIPALAALEGELHERFGGARISGEWFAPVPDLVAYISEHAEAPKRPEIPRLDLITDEEDADNLLTTTEAAARLGIPRRTLQAHVKAGRFPAQKTGRDYLIEEAALAQFAKPKRGRPTLPPKPAAPSGTE